MYLLQLREIRDSDLDVKERENTPFFSQSNEWNLITRRREGLEQLQSLAGVPEDITRDGKKRTT